MIIKHLGKFGSMNINFWHGKRVLLTGHTGFKGGWLSLVLKKFGADVFGFSLKPDTNPNFFEACSLSDILHHQVGDIRDFQFLKDYLFSCKPDIVIHMAAQPLVRYSYKNPLETYSTNVMGTANILEAVRLYEKVGATIIVTTDKCYENKEQIWSYREADRLGGHDPYSNSKACAELVTSAYVNSYFLNNAIGSVASVRAGNVIGGGDWSLDRLIPDIVRFLNQEESPIIRNPNALRPWQHVLESISGYLSAAEKIYGNQKENIQSWNFGPDENNEVTVFDLIKMIYQHWPNAKDPTFLKTDNLHEATLLKLDSTKARHELGWVPKWNISTTIEKTVEWYKSFYDKKDIKQITNEQIDYYFKL